MLPVVLFAALLAGSPPVEERASVYVEWAGMNVGAGAGLWSPPDEHGPSLLLTADILLVTWVWNSAYLTTLEIHSLPRVGLAGLGTRVGWRLRLSAAHDIRIGAYVGIDVAQTPDNLRPVVGIRPHIQYVHTTALGSVGVGFDIGIHSTVEYPKESHGTNQEFILFHPSLYLRWTLGRTNR